MKPTFLFIFVLSIGLMMISCSSTSPPVFVDPFQELQDMANVVSEQGGVAAVGLGTSPNMNNAKDKAKIDAQGALAENFEAKTSRLRKSFIEEIGGDDPEINETFLTVTKVTVKKTLVGATLKKTNYFKDKKTGKYNAGVLLVIDPRTINQSLLDEMKNHQKLYERFRSSKAFEELEKEMEDYDEGE